MTRKQALVKAPAHKQSGYKWARATDANSIYVSFLAPNGRSRIRGYDRENLSIQWEQDTEPHNIDWHPLFE